MDLESFKEYLCLLDYPQINTLNDIQLAELFGPQNRIFLLLWALRKCGITLIEKNPKKQEMVIADLVNENGFCSASQKLKFVQSNLDIGKQLQIFEKIFAYILPNNNSLLVLDTANILFDDIKNFTSMDLNLFPEYGNLKARSAKERINKLTEYQDEVDTLEEKIASLESTDVVDTHFDAVYENSLLEDDLLTFLENFQRATFEVLRYKLEKEPSKSQFSDEFLMNIKDNSRKAALILQHLECSEMLKMFMESYKPEIFSAKIEDNFDTVKNLYEKTSAFINLLKNSEDVSNVFV